MSLFDLTDRCIVVTGARGLIGRPVCAALAEAGARVVGLDVQRARGLEDGNNQTHTSDILDLDDLERSLDIIPWPLDGLLLLHGLDAKPGTSDTDPWREWQTMVDVNLTGVKNACHVFGTAMAEAGRGSIITVGSLYAGLAPDQRLYSAGFTKPAAYSAGKAGVLGLTRYLAGIWGAAGVRVNCLSPGGIGSDSTPPDFRERFEQRVPLGRMGTPGDLAGAIIWLLSDASAYVSGQEICVNGGAGIWP